MDQRHEYIKDWRASKCRYGGECRISVGQHNYKMKKSWEGLEKKEPRYTQ